MSDKFQKITVILDKEYDLEGIKNVIDAIKMVKLVADAVPGEPMHGTDYVARTTVLNEFIGDIFAIMSLASGYNANADSWNQIKTIAKHARTKLEKGS